MDNQIQKSESFTINYFNPDHLNSIQRIANMFSASDLVPKIYKISDSGKEKAIANCIIALDMASRLNANPLMIMQNLNVIQGWPSWSSKFLIATINNCGRFDALKYKFESKGKIKNISYTDYEWSQQAGKMIAKTKTFTDEVENIVCYAYTTEKGNSERLEGSEISIEMAIKEGWYTKNGSKWPIMPKQMLMYRAASFWCNVYAPELSMGIKTIEENEDIVDAEIIELPTKGLDQFKTDPVNDQKKLNDEVKQPTQKSLLDFSTAV